MKTITGVGVALSAALEVLNCNGTLCEFPSPVMTELSVNRSVTPAAVPVSCVSTKDAGIDS